MAKIIKMRDLIKSQGDIIRKQHMWTEAEDDNSGGEDAPFKTTKIKN